MTTFVTNSTGKWSAQGLCSENVCLRLLKDLCFPAALLFTGVCWMDTAGCSWIQLWWSRPVASSPSCPRGDILYQVLLMNRLKPPLVTLLLQLSRPRAGFRLVSPGWPQGGSSCPKHSHTKGKPDPRFSVVKSESTTWNVTHDTPLYLHLFNQLAKSS